MVDVRTSASRASDRVRRLIRLQPAIYLADLYATDVELELGRQIGGEGILPGENLLETSDHIRGLLGQLLIRRIRWNVAQCFLSGVDDVRIRSR